MNQYLYFNTYTKEHCFFEALNDFEARHFVINHFDLSEGLNFEGGPNFIQIYHNQWSPDNQIKLDLKNFNSFKIIINNNDCLKASGIGNFFRSKWAGENAICYSNKPLINNKP